MKRGDKTISEHIDIIVVTYNSRYFLHDFFTSLKYPIHLPFQLTIIDNRSVDKTREYLTGLQKRYSLHFRSRLIMNRQNLGLAKAWNLGIKQTNGKYIVLVNPDIKFTPGWLEQMTGCAERHPQAGIIGAKILNYNETIDHAGFQNGVVHGRGEPNKPGLYEDEAAVDNIHGCCFLIKRAIIPVVGFFDERFFLYAEEDDYCMRVKKAGYQVIVSPATIYHYGSGSTISRQARNQYHQASLAKMIQKWG